MRRKVIQEFVNSFCQRVIDLPSGYDLASFAHYGTGKYRANILTGECSRDENPIPQLRLCDLYREWLYKQLESRGIPKDGIQEAALLINVDVKDVNLHSPFGHRFASAHFFFTCHSEIKTDEKTYVGQMQGDREWGFDWYYERLFGDLPEVWPAALR